MKLFNFLTKNKEKGHTSGFADFFLHASEKEKKKAFTEAAKRANEDQRTLIEKLHQKTT